jgi:hypothetical protein
MTEYESIIKAIVSKENWRTKILNDKITKKWINELIQQNCNEDKAKRCIQILRKVKDKFKKNVNELKDYDWFGLDNNTFDVTDIDEEFYNFKVKEKNKNVLKEFQTNLTINCNGVVKNLTTIHPSESNEIILRNSITKEEIILYSVKSVKIDHLLNTKLKEKNEFFNSIVTCDFNLINQDLKNEFISILHKTKATDLHPWSNNQVFNYFHPSMYPFINLKGVNRITKCFNRKIDNKLLFQWLATDVKVNYSDSDSELKGEDVNVTLLSSINNCSNQLNISISKILAKFIPLFNNLLNTLFYKRYIDYRNIKFIRGTNIIDKKNKNIPDKIKLDTCQFIIKAQKIVLNVDDGYNGIHKEGSLHLEGTKYERIMATGIYYFNVENVNKTKLNFNIHIDKPNREYLNFRKNQSVESFYHLNAVETEEDLCIVFPNFLYHKVDELSLLDPSKMGCREILVFWLVDPNIKILSTANVKSYITEEDAKIYRELLMFERKYIQSSLEDEEYCESESEEESDDYNLCEH